MVRERLKNGVLEPCHGAYRNPWFLVAKKDAGKYRLINAAMEINRVTLRDAALPPDTDSFSEDFAGCAIASLIDFFSGYDQIPLAEKSRDLTAFETLLGLMRMTTLPQGATNSVGQFMRVVLAILREHISHRARAFLDDVAVKGPRTKYGDEEILPGIRRYVAEHIQDVDEVLADIERAGCTVAGGKSQFLVERMKVVGYVTDIFGRHPDEDKVAKIVAWPVPVDVTGVRAFIGVCVYFRIWIACFALVAKPLFALMKKEAEWEWTTECQTAMDRLKTLLSTAPVLARLDNEEGSGVVYVLVDASGIGWGGVICQATREDPKKRKPIRYESGVWSETERRLDAGKRECRGVLCAFKKFRPWLYGRFFILEIDAKVLAQQLNRPATDLPNSAMARWVAWIRLFDFEVRHVAGERHQAPDGLSRRPAAQSELEEPNDDQYLDDMIDAKFFMADIEEVEETPAEPESILEGKYSQESHDMAYYLVKLKRPPGYTADQQRALKKRSKGFFVKDKRLLRQSGNREPIQIVLDDEEERESALRHCHELHGHRGREGTYQTLRNRYYWPQMIGAVEKWVKSCEECQKRNPGLQNAELHPTM
jgi:hypothetical protein